MTLDTFFEKFELLADAPNAVARMRELILELAVQGRLVEKGKPWDIVKLKGIASKIGSGATPAGGRENYSESGIPLIRSMNVHFRGFDPEGLAFLNEEQAKQLASVTVKELDVLLNITGASIGRVTTAPKEMEGARVNQHVMIIRPTSEVMPSFLSIFLASPSVQSLINEVQVGATRQALTKGMVEQFDIPLPPLAEQKRIVAKVDELMALCDRLEAQQQDRDTRQAILARAALSRFADAPTVGNLGYLFHPAFSIAPGDLRKAILTLAVRGKLGTNITSEQSLTDDGTFFKKDNGQDLVAPADQFLDDIPANWRWVKFRWLGDLFGGMTPSMNEAKFWKGDIPWISPKDMHVDSIHGAEMHVTKKALEETSLRLIRPDSLLFVARSGILKRTLPIAVSVVPCVVNQDIKVLAPHNTDLSRYLVIMLRGFEPMILKTLVKTGTTVQSLKFDEFKVQPFPIPPLAEQHRIVDKVDQLMALVDQLETQLTQSKAAAARVLEAVVQELSGGGKPDIESIPVLDKSRS